MDGYREGEVFQLDKGWGQSLGNPDEGNADLTILSRVEVGWAVVSQGSDVGIVLIWIRRYSYHHGGLSSPPDHLLKDTCEEWGVSNNPTFSLSFKCLYHLHITMCFRYC